MLPILSKVVVYHGQCTDGFASAWVFWSKYKDTSSYMEGVYYSSKPNLNYKEIYLVDFSYPKEVLLDLLSNDKVIYLIDHHKSTLDDLEGLDTIHKYTSLLKSSCVLSWEYIYGSDPIPPLLLYIQDRDLHSFTLEGTREILATLSTYDTSFEVWDSIIKGGAPKLEEMYNVGTYLISRYNRIVSYIVSNCTRYITISGYTVPVANGTYHTDSDVAHILCQGKEFAACYVDYPSCRSFTLRSEKGGLDVSSIAKQYGGGGHVNAAGFRVPRSHPLACV